MGSSDLHRFLQRKTICSDAKGERGGVNTTRGQPKGIQYTHELFVASYVEKSGPDDEEERKGEEEDDDVENIICGKCHKDDPETDDMLLICENDCGE